ncbi:MAG: FHA domain-containing protein [Candidatus Nanoarchaeia archaeon]
MGIEDKINKVEVRDKKADNNCHIYDGALQIDNYVVPLEKNKIYHIGREESKESDCDIIIQDKNQYISRHHAKIYYDSKNRQFCIEDLNSTNGTYVLQNGQWVKKDKWALMDGDKIALGGKGHVVLIFNPNRTTQNKVELSEDPICKELNKYVLEDGKTPAYQDHNWHFKIWAKTEQRIKNIPPQGWKIHISAFPENAIEISKIVLPILQKEDVDHKVTKMNGLEQFNSKGGPQQGKFITIYPKDDTQAVKIAKMLDKALAGKNFKGPKIPTDKQYKNIIYYRYGCFTAEFDKLKNWEGGFDLDIRKEGRFKPKFVKIDIFDMSKYLSDNEEIIPEKDLFDILNYLKKENIVDVPCFNTKRKKIKVSANELWELYEKGRVFGYKDDKGDPEIMVVES